MEYATSPANPGVLSECRELAAWAGSRVESVVPDELQSSISSLSGSRVDLSATQNRRLFHAIPRGKPQIIVARSNQLRVFLFRPSLVRVSRFSRAIRPYIGTPQVGIVSGMTSLVMIR